MTNHKIWNLKADDIHIKVKAIWGDGEESWIQADTLRIQDTYPLITYAIKWKLTKQPGWEWTRDYLKDDDHIASMVKAYKSSVNGTQFMFGVEIPKNVKCALEMDKSTNFKHSNDLTRANTFLPISSRFPISLSLPTSLMDDARPVSLPMETRLLSTMKMCILGSWVWRLSTLVSS
jgi:hypothetical protein